MKPFFSESDCDTWAKDGPRISLAKANRLIQERAKVVFGRVDGNHGFFDKIRYHFAVAAGSTIDGGSTHQALLICVEEIEKDSAESLLRDYLIQYEQFLKCGKSISVAPWVTRAKRLLEGK